MALINKLTAIADAIRAKTGKSAKLSLDDMVDEIGDIEGVTITDGLNDDVRQAVESAAPQFSFTTYASNGTTIRVPLGSSNINDINMPNLSTITSPGSLPLTNAINEKLKLRPSLNLANASPLLRTHKENQDYIYADYSNTTITGNAQAFKGAFQDMYALATPKSSLSFYPPASSSFPQSNVSYWWWSNAALPNSTSRAFEGIRVLILTNASVLSLANVSILRGAYVFVPKSLLNNYLSATNWSSLSEGRILAIEDNEDILHGIFPSLDTQFNWATKDISILEKLKRCVYTRYNTLTLDELITLVNDLSINESQSAYYPYLNTLIQCYNGIKIQDDLYLFIADYYKHKDENGNLIPLTCLLSGINYYSNAAYSTANEGWTVPPGGNHNFYLQNFVGTKQFDTSANASFYDSALKEYLNTDFLTLLPSKLVNILTDFQILTDGSVTKVAVPSYSELNLSSDTEDLIMDNEKIDTTPLKIFQTTCIQLNNYIWTRNKRKNANYIGTYKNQSLHQFSASTSSCQVLPLITLGTSGGNNA